MLPLPHTLGVRQHRGARVNHQIDLATRKPATDIAGVDLLEFGLSAVEVDFDLSLDEGLSIFIEYPFAIFVADRKAEVYEVPWVKA